MDRKMVAISALLVLSAGLMLAVHEQQQEILGQPRLSAGPSIGPLEAWGGAWAAEQVNDKTLYVGGVATASAEPEKVTIRVSVETKSDSALSSQQENAQKVAAIKAALAAKGIPASSVETEGYSIYHVRRYDYQSSTYSYSGFMTTHTMKIEHSNTGMAGEIIDAAVAAGANRVDGVTFGLSDQKMKELKVQALSAAASDARQKADAIANGLGISVVRVMSASEGYTYTPVYRSYAASGAAPEAMDSVAATGIEAGEITVTANVQVVFETS